MTSHLLSLNILILGKLRQFTGNLVTSFKIRQYLEEKGYFAVNKDIENFKNLPEDFINYLHDHEIHVVIGINAMDTAPILRESPVPYALVLTGPDVNEDSKSQVNYDLMSVTIDDSRKLIVFSTPTFEQTCKLWPRLEKQKFVTIPHTVKTTPAIKPTVDLRRDYNVEENAYVFTLVSSIMPVKDPLYLVPKFTAWHQTLVYKGKPVFLVIVGAKIDKEYSSQFEDMVDGTPGIIYVGPQTTLTTHYLIKESFALVNTSTSEGMALPILEAMDLGVPVIARRNPGNEALVEDGVSGLLFTDPEDFIKRAEELMDDGQLSQDIVKNANQILHDNHKVCEEKSKYCKVIDELKRFVNPHWYEDREKRMAEEMRARRKREEQELARKKAEKEKDGQKKYGRVRKFKQSVRLVAKKNTK